MANAYSMIAINHHNRGRAIEVQEHAWSTSTETVADHIIIGSLLASCEVSNSTGIILSAQCKK